MKNIRISFLALILLFFSSCFDTIEEFTINEDGSGEFSVTMDMFKMFEMISSMGGEDKLKKDKDYETVKDSSFVFGDYLSQS
ncbi:MAG: hypothetical protein JNL88_03030, partial [Bacteroidia bacterium]|nr:hypothetical protein [Bacteroidia bacterium]